MYETVLSFYLAMEMEPNSEIYITFIQLGHAWCGWLRHCATSWKIMGLNPDGVIGIFH